MPEYGSKKRGGWLKALVILLFGVAAVASVALVVVTQEPKRALSSPAPPKVVPLPQMADAKSEAEIAFRGKSFSTLRRNVVVPYSGEITKINVQEGQIVELDTVLVEYKLDRQSMIQVQKILYPEAVLTLRQRQTERKLSIDKTKNASIPIKKLEITRVERELENLQELGRKRMAAAEAIQTKERQLQILKKEMLEIENTLRQQEADLERINKDLKFQEAQQKRDLDLLEWQTNRSYSDESIPHDMAFLKAPIEGSVLWLSTDLAVKALVPSGTNAVMMSPMNTMVVRCKVHELDLVKLRTGDRGAATFDALPDKKYACKVSRIPWVSRNPALEVPADYDLECELENVDGRLKEGLTCNVRINVTQ